MKHLRLFCTILLSLLMVVTISAKSKEKKEKVNKYDQYTQVYVFGIALSFNDSITYYTDVQLLDSAKIGKYDMLQKRSTYSNQLKSYVEGSLHKDNYSTMLIYSSKQKKIDKEFGKFKKRFDKGNNLVPISTDSFKFRKPEDL